MQKTLDERIEERKKQARSRNIAEKVRVVAEKLGVPVKFENDDAKEDGHRYDMGLLKLTRLEIIAFPTQGFSGRNFVHTYVEFNKKVIFEAENNEINVYIPGNWEQKLDKLYGELSVRAEHPAKDYSKMEQREKAAKFGF